LELSNGEKVIINQEEQNPKKKLSQNPTGKWIEKDKIAYIKIPSFGKKNYEKEAIKLLGDFFNSKSLIIDLRENTGGSTPSELIEKLMNIPYRFWNESTKINFGVFKFYSDYFEKMIKTNQDLLKDPQFSQRYDLYSFFKDPHFIWRSPYFTPKEDSYQGNLYILINWNTGSAAEDFVVPFKDNQRALIFGQKSRGSTGQPFIFQFNNDIKVYIGSKRAYFPDGNPFEGKGINPDFYIKIKISDLKSDTDKVLNECISYIKKNT
jgi:carboxyl-terminal processing protease